MAELKKCCCKLYTNTRPCDINCCSKVDVSMKDILRNTEVDIKVTGLKRFKIRLKIASMLIAIACKIGGLRCKEDDANK